MSNAEEVARARRVTVRRELADLLGHVSARSRKDPQRIIFSPGPAHSRPLRLTAADTLTLDLDGVRPPDADRLPLGIELDMALYGARPDIGAVVWTSSPEAIALGTVDVDVLPIPISFAALAHAGTMHVRPASLRTDPDQAAAWAAELGPRRFVQLRGVATVSTGTSVGEALWAAYGFEELARVTRRVLRLSSAPAGMSEQDVSRVFGRMPAERRPSRDPLAYLPSLDRPAAPPLSQAWQAGSAEEKVRGKIALSCRMLAANGRLVAFLEHVSMRVPGRPEVFAMSPAIDFSSMTPADVGLISMAGDCEPVEGPYPPAPFRWFHRDIFDARPDVQAIVHTHEEYGRLFVAARRRPQPVFRNGARLVEPEAPVFEPASLVFSAEDRAAVVGLLGGGSLVHERFHGTDFVAGTIEEATVWAIQREQCLSVEARALELGEPAALGPELLASLAAEEPSAKRWWDFYEDALSVQ